MNSYHSKLLLFAPFILSVTLISSCARNYDANDHPTDHHDSKQDREMYNHDTTGLNSAAYDIKDTAGHDKTQMQPDNSTGAHPAHK